MANEVNFNITDYVGDDGNFTEDFSSSALTALGDNYKDSKVFEGIKNSSDFIKAYADTKMAYGKKLDGVIKKPGEKATDAEKTEYRKALLAELGTPESADKYDFKRPEKMPEGMQYDEEFEKVFRQVFFDVGLPSDMASVLAQKFSEAQIARHTAYVDAAKKQFSESSAQLDKDWTGEKRTVNNRQAFKAAMQFGTDDLKKLLKESGINQDVNNHSKWQGIGFSPEQRRVWANIGAAMKSDEAITDEGTPKPAASDPKTLLGKMYDHPTSKILFNKS